MAFLSHICLKCFLIGIECFNRSCQIVYTARWHERYKGTSCGCYVNCSLRSCHLTPLYLICGVFFKAQESWDIGPFVVGNWTRKVVPDICSWLYSTRNGYNECFKRIKYFDNPPTLLRTNCVTLSSIMRGLTRNRFFTPYSTMTIYTRG